MNLKSFFVTSILSLLLSLSALAGSHQITLSDLNGDLKGPVTKAFLAEIQQSSDIQDTIRPHLSSNTVRRQPVQIRFRGNSGQVSIFIMLDSEKTLFISTRFSITQTEDSGTITFEGLSHRVLSGSNVPTQQ